jgi:hypothetical protein
LHAKVSVAHRIAQTTGEINDVLAKTRDAVQQFVTRCVFFATLPGLSLIRAAYFLTPKKPAPAFAIFFLWKRP